ncbi:astacin, partial [Teladorsagia circumcincta]
MRLAVLLLVLVVSAQAGLLDKVRDFFKGGNFAEKIKTATLSKFKKLFEKTGILSLGNKLAEMRSKVMKKLELSKAKKAEIERKLKVDDAQTNYYTRKVFEMGTKQWEEATCIDFKEDKEKKAENSIILIKEDGCWSYVGRVGGEQPLSLGEGCEQVGIATHELGHALGLFHTMSRYDRDDFITVVLENVVEGFVDQYIKETPQTTTNYGFTY